MIVWLLIVSLVGYFLYHNLYGKRQKYPPGPMPLPLIGHTMKLFDPNIPNILNGWRKTYGDIYTIWFSTVPVVMVVGADLQKELMKQDVFSGRYMIAIIDILYQGTYGIIMTEGQFWKDQRRFALHTLRDLGLGKAVMEEFIAKESKNLIEHIKELSGVNKSGQLQAIHAKNPLQVCIVNIVSAICFGETFDRSDPTLHELTDLMKANIETQMTVKVALLQAIPALQHIPLFEHFGADVFKDVWTGFNSVIAKFVEKAERDLTEKTEFTNVTEAFVMEMKRRKESGDLGGFTVHQLKCSILDIFAAGFETTVTTMHSAVLRLVHEQTLQQQMYADVMEVTGQGARLVLLSDRPNLPTLNAFISEVQRTANVTPFAVPHKTMQDVEVSGYRIPAGTMVIYPTSAVHMDPTVFKDPEKFDITRFTGPDKVTLTEHVRAFGTGKRQCIGEALARAELFLLLAAIIQNFHVQAEDPQNPPTMEFDKKRPFAPINYTAVFQPRASTNGQ